MEWVIRLCFGIIVSIAISTVVSKNVVYVTLSDAEAAVYSEVHVASFGVNRTVDKLRIRQ